jgi:hypothetical protein
VSTSTSWSERCATAAERRSLGIATETVVSADGLVSADTEGAVFKHCDLSRVPLRLANFGGRSRLRPVNSLAWSRLVVLAALGLLAAEGPARSDLIRERLELGAELVLLPASLVAAERIAWRVCKLGLEAQIIHINLDQSHKHS